MYLPFQFHEAKQNKDIKKNFKYKYLFSCNVCLFIQ